MQDLIENYLRHLRVERRMSAHTEAGYRRDLAKLQRFCLNMGLTDWARFNQHDARSFTTELRRQGLSPRSIQRALSSSRGFFRFLMKQRLTAINPFTGAAAPKAEKRLPKAMSVDQVNLLVAVAAKHPLAIRDRAVMELFYSSGLRLSELVALDLKQIDLTSGLVRVLGKGNKERVVPVGKPALAAVTEWLPHRAAMAAHDQQALFVSSRGTRISRRAVQQRIQFWALRQGLDSRVHPHMLRHSFATHVLESSGELRAVQEMLGHANIGTTQVYTHLDFQHLAKVYDDAHPKAKARSRKQRAG